VSADRPVSSRTADATRAVSALVPRWFQRAVAGSVGALAIGAVLAVYGAGGAQDGDGERPGDESESRAVWPA
jgi:hypothetical protein